MRFKPRQGATVAIAAAIGLVSAGASPALAIGTGSQAASGSEADSAIDAIERAAEGGLISLASVVEPASPGRLLEFDDASVQLPASTDAPVILTGLGGIEVNLDLPLTGASVSPELELGSGDLPADVVTYDTGTGFTSVPLVHDDGSVQVTTILHGESAPEHYDYGLGLPPDTSLTIDESGAIVGTDPAGNLVAAIAPPGAIDATGLSVPTRFELTPSGFRHVVEHQDEEYAYPIATEQRMGINLISRWGYSGGNFTVHVTPLMAVVSTPVANSSGWSELVTRVRSIRPTAATALTSNATYRQQWTCHAVGKGAIGFAGFIGADKRPAWGLEGFRGTTWNHPHWYTHQCNW